MHVELNPVQIFKKYHGRYQAAQLKRLANSYCISGFKRIYHYHIRKTAGTSIARMFLGLGERTGVDLYKKLSGQSDRPLLENGLIFVGWDKRLIENGEYYFAFSHIAYDDLKLPERTFRFTSLRDPVDRVLSHYRMLLDFSKQKNPHSSFEIEQHWLGRSFDEFLDRIPKQHLQNQLFMFSRQYDVDQALERISSLDHVILFEEILRGVDTLGARLGLQLTPRHERRGVSEFEIKPKQRQRLTQMLSAEVDFYKQVKCQVSTHLETSGETFAG